MSELNYCRVDQSSSQHYACQYLLLKKPDEEINVNLHIL